MVRVYSSSIENRDFPIPRQPKFSSRAKDQDSDAELKKMSLHHLIRDPLISQHANEIRKFDETFKVWRSKKIYSMPI